MDEVFVELEQVGIILKWLIPRGKAGWDLWKD